MEIRWRIIYRTPRVGRRRIRYGAAPRRTGIIRRDRSCSRRDCSLPAGAGVYRLRAFWRRGCSARACIRLRAKAARPRMRRLGYRSRSYARRLRRFKAGRCRTTSGWRRFSSKYWRLRSGARYRLPFARSSNRSAGLKPRLPQRSRACPGALSLSPSFRSRFGSCAMPCYSYMAPPRRSLPSRHIGLRRSPAALPSHFRNWCTARSPLRRSASYGQR